LTPVAQQSAAVVHQPDCRSRTCLVTLEWKSFAAATATWEALFHANSRVQCARELTLTPPSNPHVPYRASLLFDCTSAG
jgi:hypothetical protein